MKQKEKRNDFIQIISLNICTGISDYSTIPLKFYGYFLHSLRSAESQNVNTCFQDIF